MEEIIEEERFYGKYSKTKSTTKKSLGIFWRTEELSTRKFESLKKYWLEKEIKQHSQIIVCFNVFQNEQLKEQESVYVKF